MRWIYVVRINFLARNDQLASQELPSAEACTHEPCADALGENREVETDVHNAISQTLKRTYVLAIIYVTGIYVYAFF